MERLFLSPSELLLMEKYPISSGEEEVNNRDLLVVQDFRATAAVMYGHAGGNKQMNFTGSSNGAMLENLLSPGNFNTSKILSNFTKYDYSSEYPDYSQNEYVRAIFICLFVTESLIGVLGNFLVCLTVYRNKSMHSSVNYYIVNLGICDFLVGAVVLPVKLFELTADAEVNMLNDFWCTAVRFLETIVVFASVFTLVAICFERYNAVVYPVQSRINMTNLRIRRVLTIVWVIPGLVAAPNLYPAVSDSHFLYSEYGNFTRVTCYDNFSDDFRLGYFVTLFIFMYTVPLCFIAVTCFSIAKVLLKEIPVQPRRDPRAITLEQGRRKVAKMVLVVVFAFFVCWSPYFIVTIISQLQAENFLHKGQYFFTMLLINLLAFTNSCVNPFVYFAMSARFRKGFMCIVRSLRYCSRRSRYSPENSQSSLRRTSHRTLNGVLSLQASRRHVNHRTGNNGRQLSGHLASNGGLAAPAIAGCSSSRSPGSRRERDSPLVTISPNLNFTTGNIKGRQLSHSRSNSHEQERHSSSSTRTILLQINHCHSPTCCNHLVPLIRNNDGTFSPRNQFDDNCFPWDESCNL